MYKVGGWRYVRGNTMTKASAKTRSLIQQARTCIKIFVCRSSFAGWGDQRATHHIGIHVDRIVVDEQSAVLAGFHSEAGVLLAEVAPYLLPRCLFLKKIS